VVNFVGHAKSFDRPPSLHQALRELEAARAPMLALTMALVRSVMRQMDMQWRAPYNVQQLLEGWCCSGNGTCACALPVCGSRQRCRRFAHLNALSGESDHQGPIFEGIL